MKLRALKWTRPGISAVCVIAVILIATPAQATTSYPNDYFFATGKQWALSGSAASINAPAAWCMSTGAGVTIGHLDTGADFNHPDLEGKLIPGAAFVGGNGSISGQGKEAVQDDNGHGTATAGILVAVTDNRIGVAAVAPDAKALVIKVLDQDGKGFSTDIEAGLRWAVDNGVQVINLSIGFDTPIVGEPPDNIPRAIDYAASHGVAVAVAAGSTPLPFNAEQVTQIESQALVVGALAADGAVSSYSRNPRGVNLYAPGGDGNEGDDFQHMVVSTYWSKNTPGAYVAAEGASGASSQAAGVLALLIAKGHTAAAARQRILDTAPSPQGVPQLDAARALGAGPLCGKAAAPPVAAVGRPRVVTYRPLPTDPNPAMPSPIPSPSVIVVDRPAALTQEEEPKSLTINLGPWIWVLLAALALAIFRSRRNRT